MTRDVVAVTGGDGFVGSEVLALLAELGRPVRAIGGPPGTAARARDADEAVFVGVGDVDDDDLLAELVADAAAVIHLAGPASVARSFDHPAEYARVHVGGTARLCSAMAAAGVRRLVLASSAEVYGRPERNPVDEGAAQAPRSPYGAAKVGAEAVVGAAARRDDLDAVVVRPFSVFGPGMAPWSVLGSLMGQAAAGEPLQVIDPRPVRDLVHVRDVARVLVRALDVAVGPFPRTYNACSGRGTSVGDLLRLVALVTGTEIATTSPAADRPVMADLPELVGDPTAARLDLGWTAEVGLDDGVRSMWPATATGGRT